MRLNNPVLFEDVGGKMIKALFVPILISVSFICAWFTLESNISVPTCFSLAYIFSHHLPS